MTTNGYRPSTINTRIARVRWHFEHAGRTSPTTSPAVTTTMQAARRRIGTGQVGRRPLMLDDLRTIVAGLPTILNKPADHARTRRDRALLLVGWAAALRASKLVGLDLEDVAIDGDRDRPDEGGGIRINIERSKNDQTGDGAIVAISWAKYHINSCPARALIVWQRHLIRNGYTNGALYVTELSLHGVGYATIQHTTRHRSHDSLARYDRPGDPYRNNGLIGEWW